MTDYQKFQELVDCCEAEAIQNALVRTEEVEYKAFCRAYSIKFFTPLHLVYQMDPKEVVQTVLDEKYGNLDIVGRLDDVLDRIYTLEDPDYQRQKEVNMQDFAEAAAASERARIQKRRKLEAEQKLQEAKEKPKPTSGGFDPSKLNPNNEG